MSTSLRSSSMPKTEQRPQGAERNAAMRASSHVATNYRAIGIAAVASAVAMLNRRPPAKPAPGDLPVFLRKENLAL
jgi:hypothetical protein